MIDILTRNPIQVLTNGNAGPYLRVPLDQLRGVRELLEHAQVQYWVEPAISLNNDPPIFVLNLGLYGDPKRVQAILDAAE